MTVLSLARAAVNINRVSDFFFFFLGVLEAHPKFLGQPTLC